MEKYLSPNVSPRMRGVVEKCSFCFHRYQLAMNKAYTEGRRELEEHEYQTSCTQACPAGAIIFGDLNNPSHAVTQIAKPDHKHGGRGQEITILKTRANKETIKKMITAYILGAHNLWILH
jgi:molybdopterin-containing oxidoreductase family iron-sulfur binding subunit